MKLLIVAASHRPASLNLKLAKLAAAHAQAAGIDADVPAYSEFDMPAYNDEISTAVGVPDVAQSFSKRMAGMQGIILCSPEYNWSYPGSLKNILDWTSRLKPNPLAGKTALLMSATPGSRGGTIGLTHLKTPLEALQVFVFPRVFTLSGALDAFDARGAIVDKKQRNRLADLLDDYVEFTRKLATPT